MTTRKDFIEPVHAPRPNRWAPAVSCVVWWRGQVVLQQRRDTQQWGLPGGTMEFGESIVDTARREVYEETGLRVVTVDKLVGVYSNPHHVIAYHDGEVRQEFAVVVVCSAEGDQLVTDQESLALMALPVSQITQDRMESRHYQRFCDAMTQLHAVIR